MKTDTEILDFLNSSMGRLWARWDDSGYWEIAWKDHHGEHTSGDTLREAVAGFMEAEEKQQRRKSLL